MISGLYVYSCRHCKRKFWGEDIEYMCTAESMPVKCPYCGSTDTRSSLWDTMKERLHPGSVTGLGENDKMKHDM